MHYLHTIEQDYHYIISSSKTIQLLAEGHNRWSQLRLAESDFALQTASGE